MTEPQRLRKSRRLQPDERHRALEHAIAFARGRRQELDSLRQLVPTGGKDAGLPPRWYGELAGELVGLGLLDTSHYPPGELKILAKVLGYYLWCALAAAESDRGNEPGCRRVLDGIVAYLGLPRLQNFDFNQLQPRQGDTFRPFDLTVLRKCLEPHLAAGVPPTQALRELIHSAQTDEAVRHILDWPHERHGPVPLQDVSAVLAQLAQRPDLGSALDFALWRQANRYPLNLHDCSILLEAARQRGDAERLARFTELAQALNSGAAEAAPPPPAPCPERVFHELFQLLSRVEETHRQMADCLDRGEIGEAKTASEQLRAAVAELGERLRAGQNSTRAE